MKKLLTLFLMAAGVTAALAQTPVKGIIKDVSTGLPLSLVNITTDDGKYSTISNSEGNFRLYYRPQTKKIKLSYLGYFDYEIPLNDLPKDGVYFLEPKSIDLEEVVITNTPINELLEQLIKESKAKLTSPLVLNTYYREFVNFNNEYVQFADGIVDYRLRKKGNKNKIKTDVFIKQSRALHLKDYKEGMMYLRPEDVRKSAANRCEFDLITTELLKGNTYKKYSFSIKTQQDSEGQTLNTISFTPKEDDGDDYVEGTIVYNPETNLILSMEASRFLSDKEAHSYNMLIARIQMVDFYYKSIFTTQDNEYRLYYASLHVAARIWKKNGYDNTYVFKNDLVVTKTGKDESVFESGIKMDKRSIYEMGQNYSEKYWETGNVLPLTDKEQQIIDSLEY